MKKLGKSKKREYYIYKEMLKGLKKGNENNLPSVKIKRDAILAEIIGVLKKRRMGKE